MVTHLSGEAPLHELEVEANNWMGALRAGRGRLSEDGGVPPGASCAVAPDGTVTILDPASRRRFLLAPDPSGSSTSTPAQPAVRPASGPPRPETPAPSAPAKKRRFQTVAYVPEDQQKAIREAIEAAKTDGEAAAASAPTVQTAQAVAVAQPATPSPVTPSAQPAEAAATPAPGKKKKRKFETVAFTADEWRSQAEAEGLAVPPATADSNTVPKTAPASQASSLRSAAPPRARTSSRPLETVPLTLLMQRDEAPSATNPLTYAERAYLLPDSATVSQAEAALRFKLADIQKELAGRPRGQFINLAVFDHRWEERPSRPPLVVIEWKDWKGAPSVDYPAADLSRSSPPPAPSGQDDRLADVFEALTELPHKPNASAALEFAVQLLCECIPSEAISGCLYDINTDDMRFVAASGPGSETRKGTAVRSSDGLLGQAAHGGDRAVAIQNVAAEPRYKPDVDGRQGLTARNQLLRPLVHEGHLVGILQLTNRTEQAVYDHADINLINYMAERLADFIYGVRMRRQSHRPPAP